MPPISLFYSLPFSHAHEHACMCTHTHAHTQMSHRQVVFVLETRQPEVGVGEPLLLQFQQVGKLRVRMVCSSLQVTLNAFHFTILLPSYSTCICPPPPPPPPPPPHTHTHTHSPIVRWVFILWTRQPEAEVEVTVGEPLLL